MQGILDLLKMEINHGKKIRITAIGPDAQAAVDALVELINNKFLED